MKINGNAPKGTATQAGSIQSNTQSNRQSKTSTMAAPKTNSKAVDQHADQVLVSDKGAKLQAHERDLAESRNLIDMIESGKLSDADEARAIKRVDQIHRKYEQPI